MNELEIIVPDDEEIALFKGTKLLRVTEVLNRSGFAPDFSKVPRRLLEFGMARGRAVHKACEYYDLGELDLASLDPRIEGYVGSYIRFCKESGRKVIETEQRLMSESLSLCGKPDLICWLGGKRVVVDRKTGNGQFAALQTAGYMILWNQVKGPQNAVSGRYTLSLRGDGSYKLAPHADPDDVPAFMDCLEFAQAHRKIERWSTKYAPFLTPTKEETHGNNGHDTAA